MKGMNGIKFWFTPESLVFLCAFAALREKGFTLLSPASPASLFESVSDQCPVLILYRHVFVDLEVFFSWGGKVRCANGTGGKVARGKTKRRPVRGAFGVAGCFCGGVDKDDAAYLLTKISRAMAESMANSEKPTLKM